MTPDTDAGRIAELEEDNKRLRRLLDQRDAPGELRHRLRSTLALLRAVIRKSAETERSLSDYVAHLEDRLDAIARAQAAADEHGEVDLKVLLADELLRYGSSEGDTLLLSGPDVRLKPKAGQILALAAHELAVNAVEHGVLGAANGRIEVSWSGGDLGSGETMVLSWNECGPAVDIGPVRSGFGTEVLSRMLAYDLAAKTEVAFVSDGLRCTIHLPLPEHVGRVVLG